MPTPRSSTVTPAHKRARRVGILVIVLAVVLAAAWAVYQEFVVEKPVANTSQAAADKTAATAAEPAKKTRESCLAHENLCFTHPDDWSVVDTSSTNNGLYAGKAEIKNAKDETILHFMLGPSGLGGGCSVEHQTAFTVVESVPTKLTGYAESSEGRVVAVDTLSAVKVVRESRNGGYFAAVYLSNAPFTASPGESRQCELGYSNYFNGKSMIEDMATIVSFATGDANAWEDKPGGEYYADTFDGAKSLLEGDDMKEAFDILKSVYYK